MPAIELAALLGTPALILAGWGVVAWMRHRPEVGPASDHGTGLHLDRQEVA